MQVRKRMFMVIGTLSVMTLGLVGAAGVPSVLSIRKLVGQIAEEQGKIDARYALRRYVRNSVANLMETRQRLATLSDVAVREGQELDFITAIEGAANASGVEQKITLETVNQKDVSAWEREIPVKFEVQGTYPNVLRFINAVERLPYYVLVDSIQISAPRQSSEFTNEGLVGASIHGVVYWQSSAAPDFVLGKADAVNLIPADEEDGL